EVGQTMAREVLLEDLARGEDKTLCGNAARLGFAFEIAHGGRIVVEQPKHASIDSLEQAHPNVEQLGRDLEAAVEGAEDEARVGKPLLRARRRALRDRALLIVRLIAVGHEDDLLA